MCSALDAISLVEDVTRGVATPAPGTAYFASGTWVYPVPATHPETLLEFEFMCPNEIAGQLTITTYTKNGSYNEVSHSGALDTAEQPEATLLTPEHFGEMSAQPGQYWGFWSGGSVVPMRVAGNTSEAAWEYGGLGHHTSFNGATNPAYNQLQVRIKTTAREIVVTADRLLALEAVAAHPLAGKKVTIVGTSLVAQGVMSAAFAAETGAIVQKLGFGGGALGVDARSLPHYGSGQVTALLPSIAADADVILLDMLVNDVAASDVPLGTVTDTTPATYCGALANYFNWCETNRPGAAPAVVVQTAAAATFVVSDYSHGHVNANGNTLEDFQNATRRACDYYGRPYIDPNRYGIGFLDSGEDTADGLHWDTSGGKRAAKIYAKETRDLCEAGWLDEAGL